MATSLSTLQESLVEALSKSASASKQLEEAEAKLEPLRTKAAELKESVSTLMAEFQRLTGQVATPVKRGPRRQAQANGKRVYNINPAKKIEATYKRTLSRFKNSGVPIAEAKRRAKLAADGLKLKLGMK